MAKQISLLPRGLKKNSAESEQKHNIPSRVLNNQLHAKITWTFKHK